MWLKPCALLSMYLGIRKGGPSLSTLSCVCKICGPKCSLNAFDIIFSSCGFGGLFSSSDIVK